MRPYRLLIAVTVGPAISRWLRQINCLRELFPSVKNKQSFNFSETSVSFSTNRTVVHTVFLLRNVSKHEGAFKMDGCRPLIGVRWYHVLRVLNSYGCVTKFKASIYKLQWLVVPSKYRFIAICKINLACQLRERAAVVEKTTHFSANVWFCFLQRIGVTDDLWTELFIF